MLTWITTIWNIALLRRGPQDLPTGPSSPVLSLSAFAAIVVISRATGRQPLGVADLVVSLGLPLAATSLVLAWRGVPARFGQTVAALFGTGALISLVNIPLWLYGAPPVPVVPALLALLGLFWSLAVDGHIWRHALNLSYAGGLGTAVIILIAQFVTFQALAS